MAAESYGLSRDSTGRSVSGVGDMGRYSRRIDRQSGSDKADILRGYDDHARSFGHPLAIGYRYAILILTVAIVTAAAIIGWVHLT